MQKKSLPLFIISLAFPSFALAHERWFVEQIDPDSPMPAFFSWNAITIAMAVTALIGLIAATSLHLWAQGKLRPRSAHEWLKRNFAPHANRVLTAATGLLLFSAGLQGILFAPELRLDLSGLHDGKLYPLFLNYAEIALGLIIALGIFPKITAIMGLAIFAAAIAMFGVANILAYVVFVGIFIYVFLMDGKILPKIQPYALPFLRIFLGLGFLFAALQYKVLHPQYALEFVTSHSVNFLPMSNEMFVFAAALTEILLGLCLILGILPRLVSAVIFAMFVVTLFVFGIRELVGHLPVFGALFVLIARGGGDQLILIKGT